MPEIFAEALVYSALTYFAVGLIFALAFVARGAARIDPAAASPSLLLRMLWIPGSAAFWPLLLRRWLLGTPPPTEVTAHRTAARVVRESDRGRSS